MVRKDELCVQVSQLHVHVAGRKSSDPAWPQVHLGAGPAVSYDKPHPGLLDAHVQDVQKKFFEVGAIYDFVLNPDY